MPNHTEFYEITSHVLSYKLIDILVNRELLNKPNVSISNTVTIIHRDFGPTLAALLYAADIDLARGESIECYDPEQVFHYDFLFKLVSEDEDDLPSYALDAVRKMLQHIRDNHLPH